MASRLKTRTTPHIEIELDDSVERAFRVMDKIKEARATDADGGKSTEEPVPLKKDDDSDEAWHIQCRNYRWIRRYNQFIRWNRYNRY